MIGIRCDANSIIASGHMMRCLTIAKELVRQGEPVTFFVADEKSGELFERYAGANPVSAEAGKNASKEKPETIAAAQEIRLVVMDTDWQDMEGELSILEKELSERDIRCLLVDSYKVTKTYFQRLREICPVAYLDDLNADTYPVDMLINYSGYYRTLGYEEAYKNVCGHRGLPTKLLLGLEYAPLREQFYRPEEPRKSGAGDKACPGDSEEGSCYESENEYNILLTSGGADTRGMLHSTLLEAEKEGLIASGSSDDLSGAGCGEDVHGNSCYKLRWHVVVGSLVRDDAAITEFAKAHPSVQIHRSVTDMAGLMRSCDASICAAGTMLTECAAIGLPAIFYQVADNQKYNVEFWSSTGGMIFAGDATEETKGVIEKTCRELKALLPDKNKLEEMKKSLFGLTDGCGAKRIAAALLDQET